MKTLFLAGSDYVFPRTANKIIKQYAKELGIEIVGEEYVPLDSDDWTTQVAKIAAAKPDFVFNTINGSSNVGFIKAYDEAGLGADNSPIISVSIAEEEAPAMGVDLTGQYAAWNYFQSVDSPTNAEVHRGLPGQVRQRTGRRRTRWKRRTPRCTSTRTWSRRPKSFCVDAVNAASDGVTFDAPEGTVTVNGENHHIAKTGLIGQINADNQFDIVWSSDGADRARSVPQGLRLVGPERGLTPGEPRLAIAPVDRGCRADAARHPRPTVDTHPDATPESESDGRTHHPLPHRHRDRRHPVAGRARPHAHVRPDGRDQHGATASSSWSAPTSPTSPSR